MEKEAETGPCWRHPKVALGKGPFMPPVSGDVLFMEKIQHATA